ncbi:MAG: TolC family protein [bacterium]
MVFSGGSALRRAAVVLILAVFLAVPVLAEQFTLQQCIDQALGFNANVIAAENSYKSAGQDYLTAWGNVLPSFGFSANYSFSKNFGEFFNPYTLQYQTDPGTKTYRKGISGGMTLFDGGQTWYNIRSAKLSKNSSSSQLRGTLLSMAYQVKQAYYALASAIMLRKAQADALERSRKQLEVTATRYELGSASLSEKLKAEVTMATDSLGLLERINDIRSAEFALNLLMDRDPSLAIAPSDQLAEIEFSGNLEDCLNSAYLNNPDLATAQYSWDQARTSVRLAQGSWFPRVSASIGWNWASADADNWPKFIKDEAGYSFGIGISYTLFDAFSKKTSYSKAKLSALTAKENYDAARKSLTQDVHQAYLDIEKSRLQYSTAQLAERSAQEDYKLQQEKYRLGASSILELLDAQASLTQAQYQKISALYQLNVAVAGMAMAMGEM